MAVSTKQTLIFSALRQQWWRTHKIEIFSNRTQNDKQTIKHIPCSKDTTIYTIYWSKVQRTKILSYYVPTVSPL